MPSNIVTVQEAQAQERGVLERDYLEAWDSNVKSTSKGWTKDFVQQVLRLEREGRVVIFDEDDEPLRFEDKLKLTDSVRLLGIPSTMEDHHWWLGPDMTIETFIVLWEWSSRDNPKRELYDSEADRIRKLLKDHGIQLSG